jgi:hypothetical protein
MIYKKRYEKDKVPQADDYVWNFEFIKSNLTKFNPKRDASESSNKSKHE